MEDTSAGAFQSMAAGKWRADGVPEHGEAVRGSWHKSTLNHVAHLGRLAGIEFGEKRDNSIYFYGPYRP